MFLKKIKNIFSFNKKQQMEVPRYLFRYLRDDNNLEDTLSTPYLWFSNQESLNDPFELSNVLVSSPGSDVINKYLKEFHKEFIKKVHLCCFSFCNDSTLMWSHYSNGHTGVCVVYHPIPLLNEFALIKVNYSSPLPKFNMIKNLLKGMSLEFYRKFEKIVIGSKHAEWSYEEEYRLNSRKSGKNKINKKAVIGVIFGAKMEEDRKKYLTKRIMLLNPDVIILEASLVEKNGSINVPVFENEIMSVPLEGWRLQGNPIDDVNYF